MHLARKLGTHLQVTILCDNRTRLIAGNSQDVHMPGQGNFES